MCILIIFEYQSVLFLQNKKLRRMKYTLLVEELRTAGTDEYRAVIVAFINCLLACCNDVEERIKIRHDLAGAEHNTVSFYRCSFCVSCSSTLSTIVIYHEVK